MSTGTKGVVEYADKFCLRCTVTDAGSCVSKKKCVVLMNALLRGSFIVLRDCRRDRIAMLKLSTFTVVP